MTTMSWSFFTIVVMISRNLNFLSSGTDIFSFTLKAVMKLVTRNTTAMKTASQKKPRLCSAWVGIAFGAVLPMTRTMASPKVPTDTLPTAAKMRGITEMVFRSFSSSARAGIIDQ